MEEKDEGWETCTMVSCRYPKTHRYRSSSLHRSVCTRIHCHIRRRGITPCVSFTFASGTLSPTHAWTVHRYTPATQDSPATHS